MKLGSKIVLGFAATNVIYVALSAFIFLSAQPVRQESTVLSQDLLPMLDQASLVQYSTAMEGYMTQEYSRTIKAEAWIEALTYNADVIKHLSRMESTINGSPALQTPAIREGLANVRRNYQAFRDLAELLPSRLKVINSSIESVVYGQENFNAVIQQWLADETDPAHVNLIRALEGVGGNLVVNTMRVRYENDPAGFAVSYGLIGQAEKLAKELADGARTETARRAAATATDLLREAAEVIRFLEATMKQAEEETARRNLLADAAIKNAAALREAGDRQSQKVAQDSTRTLERVILSLAIGVAVGLLLSSVVALAITRGITRPINALIARLSEGAMEVDQAAGELSGAAKDLASGAKENAASLEDVSSALEELSSMTQRNAENSVEANALMSQVTGAVARADESMAKVIKAMGEISSSGAQIAKIIKTIDEIAFQTNLLALNAAVEAARAGGAGAGFAVVADEVRNLATRSAEAARNTAGLIDSTISNINSGSQLVGLTAENFATVENHAGKVDQILGAVAEASREQSQGIGQINHSMLTMDQVTQSNATSANESAHSAGALSSQAANLLAAVDELTALAHGPNGPVSGPAGSGRERGERGRKALEMLA